MSLPSAKPIPGLAPATFEIKSAQLPLVALVLKNNDWAQLLKDLAKAYGAEGEKADFFDQDALVIDFSNLPNSTPRHDLAPLLAMLRSCRLVPVAIRGASPEWAKFARSFGLVETPVELARTRAAVAAAPLPVADSAPVVPVAAPEAKAMGTMVVDKPLRSGQKIYARGADLIVLAMVNQGAEVVADGNIHVYAPLRGKAMAGASGNTQARIFSLCLEPELISIAGVYRTSENPLPDAVRGKPAQVRLSDDGQEKLLFEALKS